jgi:hypothetical protein
VPEATNKYTEWVCRFIAKGGDISAELAAALRDPLHDLPPTLVEHFNRDEKARRDFEKAAGSILGSIDRHRASPAGTAPAMTAVDLEQIVERLTDLISRQQSAPVPAIPVVAEVTGDFYTARDLAIALAKRMKATGEIHDGMVTRPVLSKKLAKAMRDAVAKPGVSMPRPVSAGYIKNKLVAWGLWPISSIK